jgi:hypothetical protein
MFVTTHRPEPDAQGSPARESWKSGPDADAPASSWRALEDDDLLHWIESLPQCHGRDRDLLDIVASARHFFVRQEAAKRLENTDRLKAHFDDRHVGQILARKLSRTEDIAYLEHLRRTSRYLEVRKAAEAQLRRLQETLHVSGAPTNDASRRP